MDIGTVNYKITVIKDRTSTDSGTVINNLSVSTLSYVERINKLSSLSFNIVLNGVSQLIKDTFLDFNPEIDLIDLELIRNNKLIGLFELVSVNIQSKGEGQGTIDTANCECTNKINTILNSRFIGRNSQGMTFEDFSTNILSISNNVVTVDNANDELDLFVGKTFTNITLQGLVNSADNGDNVVIDVDTLNNQVTLQNNVDDQAVASGTLNFFAFEEDVSWGIVDKIMNDTTSTPFNNVTTTLLQVNGNITLGKLEKTFNQKNRDYSQKKNRTALASIQNLTKTVDNNLFLDKDILSINNNQVTIEDDDYNINSTMATLSITGTDSNDGVYDILNIDNTNNIITIDTNLTSQGQQGICTGKNKDRVRGFRISPNLKDTNRFVFDYFAQIGEETGVTFGRNDISSANILLSQKARTTSVIVNGNGLSSVTVTTNDLQNLNKFGFRQRSVSLTNEPDTNILAQFGERQLGEGLNSQSEVAIKLSNNNPKIGLFTAGDIVNILYTNRNVDGLEIRDFVIDKKVRIVETNISFNVNSKIESASIKVTNFSGFLAPNKNTSDSSEALANNFNRLNNRVTNLENN